MNWIERVNAQCRQNKLDADVVELREEIQFQLSSSKVKPEALVGANITHTCSDYESVTFITDKGEFCKIAVRHGYEGCVDIDKLGDLDFSEAIDLGLMPEELHKKYEEAITVRNAAAKDKDGMTSLAAAIRHLGKDKVKELLG